MRERITLAFVLIWLVQSYPALRAQLVTPTLGKVQLESATVNAGSSFRFTITFDRPANYDSYVRVYFAGPEGAYLQYNNSLASGNGLFQGTITIPADEPGGNYVLSALAFGSGKQIQLPFDPVTVTVVAKAGLITPTVATAKLVVTEQQFLQTTAADLKRVMDRLMAATVHDSSDTPAVRQRVISSLIDAESVMRQAETKYPVIDRRSQSEPPPLFEDFRLHFEATRIQILAGTPLANVTALSPRLVLAQALNKRPPPSFSNTYPALVLASLSMMSKAVDVLQLIQQTSLYTFDLQISSRPTGATVFYTRANKPTLELPTQTTVEKFTLQYAFWTLMFHKEGCADKPYILDPYPHTSVIINEELTCRSAHR